MKRVCAVFEQPRSSFYVNKRLEPAGQPAAAPPEKRGPKTAISDEELLVQIKADLKASPFHGEGHRKVWARLRVRENVRVSRKRLLRLMREHQLLSPFRKPQGQPKTHDGKITTQAPNQMWGTDGTKVLPTDDGYVWVFVAVEHWNAECVGWHVSKRGTRFEALQPISMGLQKVYGSTHNDVARGLALRMDHGTQYLSADFLNQVRTWGISPSYGFLREPETNGVAERFHRTLKEQAIYGRLFRTVEDVRAAVKAFVDNYNQAWLVAKLGHRSPAQARKDFSLARAA